MNEHPILLLCDERERELAAAVAGNVAALESAAGIGPGILALDDAARVDPDHLEGVQLIVLFLPRQLTPAWNELVRDLATFGGLETRCVLIDRETPIPSGVAPLNDPEDALSALDASTLAEVLREIARDLIAVFRRSIYFESFRGYERHRGFRLHEIFLRALGGLVTPRDLVALSGIAPDSVPPQTRFFVVALLKRQIDTAEPAAVGPSVARGTRLSVSLKIDAGRCEDPAPQEVLWTGAPQEVAFRVRSEMRGPITGYIAVEAFGALITWTSVVIRVEGEKVSPPRPIGGRYLRSAFVSFEKTDHERALFISETLNLVGTKVFICSEALHIGEDWAARLIEEVCASEALILCWSEASRRSEWVEREWKTALEHDIPILPIWMARAGETLELPPPLRHLQARDVYSSLIELEDYRRRRSLSAAGA